MANLGALLNIGMPNAPSVFGGGDELPAVNANDNMRLALGYSPSGPVPVRPPMLPEDDLTGDGPTPLGYMDLNALYAGGANQGQALNQSNDFGRYLSAYQNAQAGSPNLAQIGAVTY